MKHTNPREPRRRAGGPILRGAAALAGVLAAAAACSSTPPVAPGASGASGATTPTTAAPTSSARPKPAKPTNVATPSVTGPITGGTYGVPFNPMPAALGEKYGYQENEYFIEGTAASYTQDGTWTDDGVWKAKTDASAPFVTRIIVRLPRDKAKFNGVVVTEWLNVSAGMDADPDWGFAHDELMRSGFGYIGVSAQKVGIVGGSSVISVPGFEIKALQPWDPERYGKLSHPGDQFSYDIFSQAAATTIDPKGVKPFDGYAVTHLLAAGESQSAFRMTTYVNAVHPLVRLFDGFLIHSRGPGGQTVTATNDPPVPKLTRIRTDLAEPVMQLETETDLFGLGFFPARQPDTDALRTWEIAGTAHADRFTLDAGVESGHVWAPTASIDFSSLCGEINTGPQTYVVRTAFAALKAWVVEGTAPAKATPITVADGTIVRDADGNAQGGIRTAAVDVPIAQLSGEQAESRSIICSLFGFTKPFTPERLAELYPSHDSYVAKVTEATQKAIDSGYVLAADKAEIVATADKAPVPN